MLKFLIISFILFFVFGKLIKYILRQAFMQVVQNQPDFKQEKPKRKEGSIHVDHENQKSKKDIGGEYIEYEIVK